MHRSNACFDTESFACRFTCFNTVSFAGPSIGSRLEFSHKYLKYLFLKYATDKAGYSNDRY